MINANNQSQQSSNVKNNSYTYFSPSQGKHGLEDARKNRERMPITHDEIRIQYSELHRLDAAHRRARMAESIPSRHLLSSVKLLRPRRFLSS